MTEANNLHHVTHIGNISSIKLQGMRSLSYWSNSAALTAYYRETVEEEGLDAVVLTIELEDLIQLVGEGSIEPDFPGIEEPITSAIGKKETDVIREWKLSQRGWRDSLQIIGSLRCRAPIPAGYVRVLKD